MPTDTERRDVARRLRGLRGGWSSGECYYTIIHALGLPDTSREDGGAALYARLADLIDPDTTSDTTKTPGATTKCDRDALLETLSCMDAAVRWAGPDVERDIVEAWADDIREALGVTDG